MAYNTEDQTQGLAHGKQALYSQGTHLAHLFIYF